MCREEDSSKSLHGPRLPGESIPDHPGRKEGHLPMATKICLPRRCLREGSGNMVLPSQGQNM